VRTGLRRLRESADGIDVVAAAADGQEGLQAVTRPET
jgi:DNA-binding NarL/FixJ family response regulator